MDFHSLQDGPGRDIIRVEQSRIVCPVCRRLTRQRVRPGTRFTDLPLWCPHCKQTSVVSYRAPVPEPESQSQSL